MSASYTAILVDFENVHDRRPLVAAKSARRATGLGMHHREQSQVPLAERYGEQFDAYSAKTKKLIPYIY